MKICRVPLWPVVYKTPVCRTVTLACSVATMHLFIYYPLYPSNPLAHLKTALYTNVLSISAARRRSSR